MIIAQTENPIKMALLKFEVKDEKSQISYQDKTVSRKTRLNFRGRFIIKNDLNFETSFCIHILE